MANAAHTTHFDRSAIMSHAWELMKLRYKFGIFTFKEIGSAAWAWCLGEAWRLAKMAVRKAAMTETERAAKIERLKADLASADYLPAHMSVSRRKAEIAEQIRDLEAA